MAPILLFFVFYHLTRRLSFFSPDFVGCKERRRISSLWVFIDRNNQSSNNVAETVLAWFTRWQSGVLLLWANQSVLGFSMVSDHYAMNPKQTHRSSGFEFSSHPFKSLRNFSTAELNCISAQARAPRKCLGKKKKKVTCVLIWFKNRSFLKRWPLELVQLCEPLPGITTLLFQDGWLQWFTETFCIKPQVRLSVWGTP